MHTHTHTHTHIYVCVYIYIYIHTCVCVCVCVQAHVFMRIQDIITSRGRSDISHPLKYRGK